MSVNIMFCMVLCHLLSDKEWNIHGKGGSLILMKHEYNDNNNNVFIPKLTYLYTVNIFQNISLIV